MPKCFYFRTNNLEYTSTNLTFTIYPRPSVSTVIPDVTYWRNDNQTHDLYGDNFVENPNLKVLVGATLMDALFVNSSHLQFKAPRTFDANMQVRATNNIDQFSGNFVDLGVIHAHPYIFGLSPSWRTIAT